MSPICLRPSPPLLRLAAHTPQYEEPLMLSAFEELKEHKSTVEEKLEATTAEVSPPFARVGARDRF